MSNLRRYNALGNIYFVTNVTLDRRPILIDNIELFHRSVQRMKERFNIDLIAWVVLPDHLHLMVDPGEAGLSTTMKGFKQGYGLLYRQKLGIRSGRVWQLRFWDHIIRNQDDFNRHVDYIHHNPVKHGVSSSAVDYQHSSFAEYCRAGFYRPDWTLTEDIEDNMTFGE